MERKIEDLARMFKALGDPTRLSIIHLLYGHKGALCVNALTKMLSVSQSAVSQHLRVLKDIGLVRGKRMGMQVHYSVDKEVVNQITQMLSGVLEAHGLHG